jgi:hypothetical protein
MNTIDYFGNYYILLSSEQRKTDMTKTDQTFKQTNAYLDAHCAAFNGWSLPIAKNEFEQQAIDRGHWDGSQARERALGA